MYRNRAILREAREHPCQLCGVDDDTVVAAHSNQLRHGKGRSIKAHDCFVAFLCHVCHFQLDQGFLWTRAQKEATWEQAHRRSVPLFLHLLDEEGRKLLNVEQL